MFNQGVIVESKGRLSREPELRFLPDGTPVTTLNLAVNRTWTDQSGGEAGEKQEETTWLRCSVWGAAAESANQYLVKGQEVLVRGRLQVDPATGGPKLYQRQDGTVGAGFEVRVFNLDYGAKPNGAPSSATNGEPMPAGVAVPDAVETADDIPF